MFAKKVKRDPRRDPYAYGDENGHLWVPVMQNSYDIDGYVIDTFCAGYACACGLVDRTLPCTRERTRPVFGGR